MTASQHFPMGLPRLAACDCQDKCADLATMERRHGTPDRFALSVYAAVPGFISVDEAQAAIDKYDRLWARMSAEPTP